MAGRKQAQITKIITFTVLLYSAWACKTGENTTELFFYTTDSLCAGDIILRKSYGMISEIITARLNDTVNISHCGILCQDSTGNLEVIHSLSKKVSDYDGMQKCSLQEFWDGSRPETVKVYRLRNPNNNRIAEYAHNYLIKKIPFDEKLDLKDTTAFYCSELPAHIIEKAFGTKIWTEKSLIKFSAFMNPAYFREIPFVYKKSPANNADR